MDFLTFTVCLVAVASALWLGHWWVGSSRHVLWVLPIPMILVAANLMVVNNPEWQWAMPAWLQANYARLNWLIIGGVIGWCLGVVSKTRPTGVLGKLMMGGLLVGMPILAGVKCHNPPVKLESACVTADGVILQSTAASCAPAAAANLLIGFGMMKSEAELARLFKTATDGTLPAHILYGLRRLGLTGLKTNVPTLSLTAVPPPALLFFNSDAHVVALTGMSNGQALIVDPAVGRKMLSQQQVEGRWSGHAIMIQSPP